MLSSHWFETERPRLFSIAYRMLSSASDAEDVVQDAWVRIAGVDAGTLESPQAFVTTVVTRLCLDRLKSARATREQYVGPWLPEPVLTNDSRTPDALAERAESVTLAFLVLLETLSAEERAVFLLKEVFEYEHAEIARMLDTTAANSRQLLHRAKVKVREVKTTDVHARERRRVLAARFAEAFQMGDTAELTQLLSSGVTFVSDGGGKVAAARRPLVGRDEVLKFLVGLHRSGQATGLSARATFQATEVNAEPALVLFIDGVIDGVFVLSFEDEDILGIRVIRNPDKLAFLDRQLRTREPAN